MSSIHEALKKAGKQNASEILSPDRATQLLKSTAPVEFLGRKSNFNWGPVFVVLVLVLITGPVVAPLFSTPGKSVPHALPATLQTPSEEGLSNTGLLKTSAPGQDIKAQFGVEEMPLTTMRQVPPLINVNTAPDFFLSGIVFSPKSSYCLINEKIVKVGDKVGSATVTSITATQAVLDYQGKQIVLSTNL